MASSVAQVDVQVSVLFEIFVFKWLLSSSELLRKISHILSIENESLTFVWLRQSSAWEWRPRERSTPSDRRRTTKQDLRRSSPKHWSEDESPNHSFIQSVTDHFLSMKIVSLDVWSLDEVHLDILEEPWELAHWSRRYFVDKDLWWRGRRTNVDRRTVRRNFE